LNKKKCVISIVGARPQFVKAAVVSRAMRPSFDEVLLHTGQHYDDNMSGIFFDELDLPKPDINLGIGGGSHAEQTGQMLIGIEEVLLRNRPDWVLIYGDTNSTLAGALAAVKLQIPVAHVEAGLRSFNWAMPEEINRIVSDRLATALFCPTDSAVENLANEGIKQGVFQVGDVMCDALEYNLSLAKDRSRILTTLGLQGCGYALVTIHRAANTDDPNRLKSILDALRQLKMRVVFPIHPRTQHAIRENELAIAGNVTVIEPVGYLDMLQLEANANCILTDSGGVQKEAYWLGVRCITLREETEWIETVTAGWNKLVGVETAEIIAAVQSWFPSTERPALFGDGQAANKINQILTNWR
jgi:UDP-GlcNAc3NAcA epimerase